MVRAETGRALDDRGFGGPMVLRAARALLCSIFALLAPACGALGEGPLTGAPVPFEASLHAQLLMRAVTGSLHPAATHAVRDFVAESVPTGPYEFELRKHGIDFPSVGHTMVGWVRLQQLYEALRTCALEGVPGDFLEAGVWRGGASIFAASVLREMGCLGAHGAPGGGAEYNEKCARDVWVCDSFQGFEPDPWDGDRDWSKLNSVVAVDEEAVRDNFHNYGLGAFLDESIHFVKGFFADTLPHLHRVHTIAVLRMDGDLFSSTSDILYNLYDRVAIGGFIVVDDYGIEQCADAVDSFRNVHQITDTLTQIDSHSKAVYWRKSAHVDLQMDVYYRYTFQKDLKRGRQRHPEDAALGVAFGRPQCVEQQERAGRVSFTCEAFDTHVLGDLVPGVEYRVAVQVTNGESIIFAIERVLHPEDTVISSQLPGLPMEPHAVRVQVLDAFPGLSPEERVLTAMIKRVEVRKSGAVSDRAVLQETMGSHALGESTHCAAARAPAPFEGSFHAQVLMRVVTGSVYPAVSYTGHIVDGKLTKQPYEHFVRKYGLDWPSVGHTMVGWVRLQQLYEALRTCALEGVPGDFLEAGVWRGGASIFAASVLREMGCLGAHGAPGGGAEYNEKCARDVWVCDSFQGFEPDPWDGDRDWSKLNSVVAVDEEAVRDNFHNYGLGAFLDESIHFVKGFFADTLPHLHRVHTIAVLRMDGDLFSSTSDILYNLYDRVAIGGFIVVDDYGFFKQCADAVDSFRELHYITDTLTQIDSHSKAVYWRKSAHVDLQWDVYEGYTSKKDLKRGQRSRDALDGEQAQIKGKEGSEKDRNQDSKLSEWRKRQLEGKTPAQPEARSTGP
jgi:O-methyltransferase